MTTGTDTVERIDAMPPDILDDDGDGRDRLCEWADQWCDEPAYGWIDTWLPDTAGDARAGRIHACQRHYAFHLETTIDAILHDPEHMAATNDEQRRVAVLRHLTCSRP